MTRKKRSKKREVPVIIVTDPGIEPTLPKQLVVAGVYSPSEIVSCNGIVNAEVEVVLIEIRGSEREELLRCGLLLRDAGKTGIVCDTRTVPLDMVKSIHDFSIKTKSKGGTVKTELLFVEGAIEEMAKIEGVEKLN